MRQIPSTVLAISLVAVMLLITVSVGNDLHTASQSDVTSMSSLPPEPPWPLDPLWEPPYREFEIIALASNQSWLSGPRVRDETCVRPAWGMLAAVVVTFLVLWTNTENSFTVRILGAGLYPSTYP